jgi:hypothetical protein
MVRQCPKDCIVAAYVAVFIPIGIPNTLLAADCSCKKMGLGLCIVDVLCTIYGDVAPVQRLVPPVHRKEAEQPVVTYSPIPIAGDKHTGSFSRRTKILETGYSLLTEIGGGRASLRSLFLCDRGQQQ